jgi:hypothetical protein
MAQLHDYDFCSCFSCFGEFRFIEHLATSTFEIGCWIFNIPFSFLICESLLSGKHNFPAAMGFGRGCTSSGLFLLAAPVQTKFEKSRLSLQK